MICNLMLRNSHLVKVSVLSALLLAISLPVAPTFGQKKSGAPRDGKIILEILDVRKNDSAAKETGGQRLVPVELRRLVKAKAGATIIELKAVLETVNTDGRSTRIEKILPELIDEVFVSTLLLPMDKGVFAKKFTVTLIAKARIEDQVVEERVSRSGRFPEPVPGKP
jgi:hypothetical protein